MNIRVANIAEWYERRKGLGAEFLTEPKVHEVETRVSTCAIPTATSSRSARRKHSGELRDRTSGGRSLSSLRLELPWPNGVVVRLGPNTRVTTPVNEFIARPLAIYAGGGEPAIAKP